MVVEMTRGLYGITRDQLQAMRELIAPWSAGSTILPLRVKDEETGKWEYQYVDFSHGFFYDTVLNPIQQVISSAEIQDDEPLIKAMVLGMAKGLDRMVEPFISESIYYAVIADLLIRGGKTRDGFEVYNEQDTPGNKTRAIFKHLVEAQMPFSFPQLKRLDRSLQDKRLFTKSKYDEYGQTYEFGDEFAGLFGFRAVAANPGRTMKYKVADYQQGVRKSGSLFTRVTLKGGPIEPREIVDAYINANRSLFQVKKDLRLDMNAARLLGISDEKYEESLDGVSQVEQNAVDDGEFRPYTLSADIEEAFQTHADEMGVANPLDAAYDAISNLEDQFSELSLDNLFPNIENPLMPMDIGTPLNIPGAATLPNVESELTAEKGIIPVTGQVNQASMFPQNIPYNQLTTQQKIDILFGRG